jgi:hypothetical protein
VKGKTVALRSKVEAIGAKFPALKIRGVWLPPKKRLSTLPRAVAEATPHCQNDLGCPEGIYPFAFKGLVKSIRQERIILSL